MEAILRRWEEDKWISANRQQHLAYIMLTECLAWQRRACHSTGLPDALKCVSPVRWSEPQDLLFSAPIRPLHRNRVQSLLVSFSATRSGNHHSHNSGMARGALEAKYEAQDGATSIQRQILCAAKDRKEAYCPFEDAPVEPMLALSESAELASTRPPYLQQSRYPYRSLHLLRHPLPQLSFHFLPNATDTVGIIVA